MSNVETVVRVPLIAEFVLPGRVDKAEAKAEAQSRLNAFRDASQPFAEYGIFLYQPEPGRIEVAYEPAQGKGGAS